MKTAWVAALAWLTAGPAGAAVVTGRDCGNGDLICDGSLVCGIGPASCSNGDQLQGTFTRVRLFSVGVGTTVFVFPQTPLVVYASTISLAGTINGVGRGFPGGTRGIANAAGGAGSGGGPGFAGGGGGGAATKGGGGGGHEGIGGTGPGLTDGGSAGAAYGAAFTSPMSADDVYLGSGGGGGGGSTIPGGTGGFGGASVYLEASSITFAATGAVLVSGAEAQAITATGPGHPGGGGGGSGGGVLIRATRVLGVHGSTIAADGGKGASAVSTQPGGWNPGGGGSGGRIRILYSTAAALNITLSTAPGPRGDIQSGSFESTSAANNGSLGAGGFGIIASSPAIAPANAVAFVTSVTWAWNVDISTWGDAAPASRRFRVYASSSFAPLPGPQVEVAAAASNGTEYGLRPNTAYTRVVTAFTDWGDSLASDPASKITLASPPGPPSVGLSTFTAVEESQLTLNWGNGTGAEANPAGTEYEVWRSTSPDFGGASIARLVALSSNPVNLAPETVHYFKVAAVNLAGALTAFTTTFFIATSTTSPSAPGAPAPDSPFSYDGKATFRWAPASAPSGIKDYLLQIGSFPGGADISNGRVGNVTSYAATGLASGKSYFARVRARSNADLDSDFSASGPALTVFVPAQEKAIATPMNWPNPFDPTQGPTNIGFSTAEAAAVTLRIFTTNGKLVHQEERRFDTPGNQIWPWSGASGSGRRVAPGGYIVVIEKRYAGGVQTQRLKLAVVY